jgi:hypothetical protein
MITTVNFKPHYWSPAYNPIVYSCTSNLANSTDMVYVFDIFVNGATAANTTIRQRPNPSGVGMLDISSIVQPYIDLSLYSVENDYYPYFYGNSSDILATVSVLVGEQYENANGVIITQDGYGNPGSPQFPLGAEEGGSQILITPAALPYATAINNMSSTTNYVYWSDYIMDGDGLFLSQDASTRYVYDYDYSTLSFLNWNNAGAAYNSAVQLIQFKQYNDAGTLIRTDNIQNTTLIGGGPQSLPNYTSQSFNRTTTQLTVKTGPANLQTQGIWDANTASYTAQAFIKASATTSTTPGATASQLITYQVQPDCNYLYPRVRLSWLNELGGRDYWNFTMFYQKVTNSPGSEYFQTPLNWSGTRPVAVNGVDNNLAPNYMRGGSKSFNKTVTQTMEVQTDWLTQDQVDFLGYISQSPDVLGYVGDTNEPMTVKVLTIDYAYRLVKQVKLIQATYNLQYTKVQQKQNQ